MKSTTRRRAARKLVLPLVAVAMMTSAMYLGSGNRARPVAPPAAPAHAR